MRPSRTAAIVVDREQSRLLRLLDAFLPQIAARLGDASGFRGWRVGDDDSGASYTRLVCGDELVGDADGSGRELRVVVAVHEFAAGGRGELHDHRFPLAVLPLALHAGSAVLYRMPWQRRATGGGVLERGEHVVRTSEAYAIEEPSTVWHAVHSLRAHQSIVLTDVSAPPTREDRLRSAPLAAAACGALLARVTRALRSS